MKKNKLSISLKYHFRLKLMGFIKNREELLDVPENYRKSREIIIEALESTIESVHPDTVIPENVEYHGNILRIGGNDFKLEGRLAVFGMGKASYNMALALHRVLGDRIDMGIVNSIKDESVGNIQVMKASHPFPDEITVENTRKAVNMAETLGKNDVALVLISGGGSSMFCMPHPAVSIEDMREISEALMKSGADIWELNTVRRSISIVKGGGFTRYLRPAKVISLIISDVVDNHLPSIASGPTVSTGFEGVEAERILKKYGLWEGLSEMVKKAIMEGRGGESADMNLIIADNRRAVNHASVVLTSHGIGHRIKYGVNGYVDDMAKDIKKERMPVLMGGESTAKVVGNGKGGRNQELALRAIMKGFKGTAASIGTDGIDGNSRYAGAIADEHIYDMMANIGINPEDFLKNSDSSSFFERVGGAIYTGYTGTNVADVIIAIPNQ